MFINIPNPRERPWLSIRSSRSERRMERETGIEPATNSLEGCDSTTELLPPSRLRADFWTRSSLRRASPPTSQRPSPPTFSGDADLRHASHEEGWWGGEGSNLRSPKATGLQPVAIDRSATSPNSVVPILMFGIRAFRAFLKTSRRTMSSEDAAGGAHFGGAGGGI